jgi:hypothetical protein
MIQVQREPSRRYLITDVVSALIVKVLQAQGSAIMNNKCLLNPSAVVSYIEHNSERPVKFLENSPNSISGQKMYSRRNSSWTLSYTIVKGLQVDPQAFMWIRKNRRLGWRKIDINVFLYSYLGHTVA